MGALASGSRIQCVTQISRIYLPARAGLAFGAWLGETQHVTDDMLMAASETLPDLIRPTDMSLGRVFPRLADIRRGAPALAPAPSCLCSCCQWVQGSTYLTRHGLFYKSHILPYS